MLMRPASEDRISENIDTRNFDRNNRQSRARGGGVDVGDGWLEDIKPTTLP